LWLKRLAEPRTPHPRTGLVIPSDVQTTETLPRLRSGRLATVADAGHLLPLEAGEAVADLIRGTCLDVERQAASPAG
jgi:pimeloyl-ACP methyl ester carboxylesterase